MKLVPLNRALSKLGILSRAEAAAAIRDGRVRVNGRIERDPMRGVVPETLRVQVDGRPATRARWRTIVFHKPRGVVTTRRDPQGRQTVFDVLGDAGRGLVAVGRLDWATSGLLVLTTDTRLADWMADPSQAIPRVYVVTVRGRVTDAELSTITAGIDVRVGGQAETVRPHAVQRLKSSARETHLVVELRQGRNREVRRLFEAVGHDVTRLKRVGFGRLELDDLRPGAWRDLTRSEVRAAFGAPQECPE